VCDLADARFAPNLTANLPVQEVGVLNYPHTNLNTAYGINNFFNYRFAFLIIFFSFLKIIFSNIK